MSKAADIIAFFESLEAPSLTLPTGINMINPYRDDQQVMEVTRLFYNKYYNDNRSRALILGINPGRFGGGATGIPFTDPKRLEACCGITYPGKITHEPSSVFVYEMIAAFGAVEKFYSDFYISSLFPLALVKTDERGKQTNYNYYDDIQSIKILEPAIVENIRKQITHASRTDVCFCFGTGKNEKILSKLNQEHHFFETIIPLEHPRFIMQYKTKQKQFYIDKYLQSFRPYVSE